MKKTIWIIDHYSSEPVYGGISRQYDFAKELSRQGYNVIVIASGYSHFTHQYITGDGQDVKVSHICPNARFIYLRTVPYENNSGMGRARNMADFMAKAIKYGPAIARRYGKPDAVTGCSVHPLAWIAAYQIAHKYHARFVAEVRDFWPRIWVISGEKKAYSPMVLFFGAVQKWAFWHASRIIYSMYHGEKYICGELGVPREKVFLIGQPIDCRRFDANSANISLLPQEIQDFIGDRDSGTREFVCTFAGYYMKYEGVYVMLEALKILERKGLPVKMVFVGSGQEKEGMQAYIKANSLQNALVYGRIPKESVPALLSRSDICMAHLEVEGHKEVYRYGVSKNKVNEYLYSGACTLYGFLHKDDEVASSGGGLMFEPYDADDLAAKIESVYKMPESQRRQFGIKGREYMRANHSSKVLAGQMAKVLFGQ